ncbi:MAG TPA: hypothetical protein VI451_11425 [Anaerolineales bacterium]|nr:hypothetical protein [Anaerolineales bacterium]
MSLATFTTQNANFLGYRLGNTGVSREAYQINELFFKVVEHLFKNETFGESRLEGYKSLEEVAQEANEPNWDGYNGIAVNALSLYQASEFLNALPASIPTPEIGVDPDGEISFDWYRGKNHLFSVSVGETGKLTFAGIFGLSKIHGVEYMGDVIPGIILLNIQRVLGEDINYP